MSVANQQESTAGKTEAGGKASLPLRDWILLPLVGLLTVVLMMVSTEAIARRLFRGSATLLSDCLVFSDPVRGVHARPNSVCFEKDPESPGEEYRFNSCGHRAGEECGPKPAGTFRITMIGSSTVLGERVQREQSFAALLPAELSRITGKKVEIYNEGMGFGFAAGVRLRFDEVLATHPDMILWPLTFPDVEGAEIKEVQADPITAHHASMSLAQKAWYRVKSALGSGSPADAAAAVFLRTRTSLMLRHYLYESRSEYISSILRKSDIGSQWLMSEPDADWQRLVHSFEYNAAVIEAQAREAGIPFVAIYIPVRTQLELASLKPVPVGWDPLGLNRQLRSIITAHGGIFLDTFPDLRNEPDLVHMYYPVDGHLTAEGHRKVTDALAKELTSGAIPQLYAGKTNSLALRNDAR